MHARVLAYVEPRPHFATRDDLFHTAAAQVGVLYRSLEFGCTMASHCPPDVERYSKLLAPDAKRAKSAVAKAAKSLRVLLTDKEERLAVLVEHGLLRDKNVESLTKELQDSVERSPALFWVLLREISVMEDGSEAAAKLEGMLHHDHLVC